MLMRKFLFVLLTITLGSSDASLASGKARAAVSPPHPTALATGLSLRGGAGPLSAQQACQLLTVVTFLDGGLGVLSPKKALTAYGVANNPLNEVWIFGATKVLVAIAVLGLCLLEKGTSLNTALGSSALVMALADTQQYLNEEYKVSGSTESTALFTVAMNAVAAIAGLTNQSWAETYFKVYYGFALINGIGFAFFGDELTSMWGCKKLDAGSKALTKMLGHWVLALGAMSLCLLNGVAKERAYGIFPLSSLAMLVFDFLITKDLKASGMKQGPVLFWAALQTLISASIYL